MYTPDNWIILKIAAEEELLYKVLAGWSGGYLDGDAWRMNSGITRVEQDGDYHLFMGHSGSVYKCYKDSEEIRMNIAGIFSRLREAYPDRVTQIDYEDFVKEFKPLAHG